MPFPKITHWIVVADAAGYRIFSCLKLGGPMKKVAEKSFPEAKKFTRELGTDRPGRNQAGPRQARHAFANPADWHEQEEKEVARALADLLNERHREKAFDRLVLVAPPKMLGDVREFLEHTDNNYPWREIDKDLARLSSHELEGYFKQKA